ncbi:MAG: GAF domain-containing protein [Anaerolineales bacterium]|jgi:two-component system nitrate/nitrite sensor histidine kinase NarX
MKSVKSGIKIPQVFSLSPSVRWVAAGISLLVILIFMGTFWIWPRNNLLLSIFSGIVIAGLIYFIAGQFIQLQVQLLSLQNQIADAEREMSGISSRSDAIFRLSRRFVEANNEKEVLTALLNVVVDISGAVGASVVPLDDRGQPMTALSFGGVPEALMNSWVEYLASPAIRQRCGSCQQPGSIVHVCPLVDAPIFDHLDQISPASIYCLHLRRGEREYGILNLYLHQGASLEPDLPKFLQTLLDETALVLESLQLQKRELVILQQMRHQTNPQGLQLEFLENVQETLKADFVLLQFDSRGKPGMRDMSIGEFSESNTSIVESVIGGVQKSGVPVLLGDVESEPGSIEGFHSLIAAPLMISDEPAFGAILAGNIHSKKFNSRHLSLLQTLAGQISLVVRNSELRAEIEFNSIMSERTRLAREIHDGLAQTLGFLKLQAAQMENFLAAKDTKRLETSLSQTYKVLSEAYLDVRQAIDDLRISPSRDGLTSWLEETSMEFEDNTGLVVNIEGRSPADELPLEIQVQLIRIIQEALSNVRKHAQATQAWIDYHQAGRDFLVEIRDDGRGFHPDEIPGVSKYGLQGMRERSEMIGAELQIISAPEEGTIIKIRVPVPKGELI